MLQAVHLLMIAVHLKILLQLLMDVVLIVLQVRYHNIIIKSLIKIIVNFFTFIEISAQQCRPIVDFIGVFEVDQCKSQEVVNVTMCEGQCTSASVFSVESGNFVKQCSCCSATETEEKTVNLTCPDGSTVPYSYKIATKCSCGATTCGSAKP